MKRPFSAVCLAIAGYAGLAAPLPGGTISFRLLGDPGQNYTFTRSDPGNPQVIYDPVAPYPGWLGTDASHTFYGFFCIDYLKTATWNTTYPGVDYGVQDPIPGKTEAQLVEAAYLSDKLFRLGGSSASTSLYQGPISFAVWQIMDPTTGHVPVDPAAQTNILEAEQAYTSGAITAADYPNTRIFVPDDPRIQDFMTLSEGVPETGTLSLLAGGLLLVLGKLRLPRQR
jgi:hypothetical protein